MLNLYSCCWCSGHFLEINYRLIKQLNPSLEFRWFICNQNPSVYNDIILHDEYVIFERENDLKEEYVYGMGSVSHGNGLNLLAKMSKDYYADYHLVLDPDFFCFWSMDSIIKLLSTYKALGVTYPNRFRKYRLQFITPTSAIFTIYQNIDFSSLDFRAELNIHPPIGDDFDPSGSRDDVGFKVMERMILGDISYYSINNNMEEKYCDAYYESGRLFGVHIHCFREQQESLVQLSDDALMRLSELYGDYKSVYDPILDFSFFTKDLGEYVKRCNISCMKLKEMGHIPKNT